MDPIRDYRVEAAAERVRAFIAARRSMTAFDDSVQQVGVRGELFDLNVEDLVVLVQAIVPGADVEPIDRRGLDAKRREVDWTAAHRAEADGIIRRRHR